jgi:hypothetical protein
MKDRHVSRGLVEVRVGRLICDDRQYIARRKFDVGRVAGHNLGIGAADRHVGLLEGTDVIQFSQRQILDFAIHPRDLGEHVDTRI